MSKIIITRMIMVTISVNYKSGGVNGGFVDEFIETHGGPAL